jgi:4-amino-4-deoxy-L-arabinose transferase-like glycosyltransferase
MHGGLRRFSQALTGHRALQVVLIALLCLALAFFAQRRLDRKVVDYRALLSYGVAAALFAFAFGDIQQERAPDEETRSSAEVALQFSRSLGPLAALWAVALLGCLDFGGNRFRPLGLVLWGGGLLLSLCYLYLSDGRTKQPGALSLGVAGKSLTLSPSALLLGVAILLGAWFRLSQLDVIPADIGWDLPYNYTDVLSILRGQYNVFFPANMGREGMFMYLIALVTRFGELSHFLIKFTSALVGIVTIPALYLAARELFTPAVGIMAAFLLAVNRWHIVLSRSGFRVILLPLFVILLLYALVRALRTGRLFDFGLAGLVLGLGLHTYTGFLFAPVAIACGLVLYLLSGRWSSWRSCVPSLIIVVAITLVGFAPLGRFALEHRNEYMQRLGLQVKLVRGDPQATHMTLPLFLQNVRTSLLMFNAYGDSNERFNVPGLRHLGFISGILLVLGLFYVVRRWRQGENALLLSMFFVFIVPMTLAMVPHEMPNVFRGAGTIGPALIIGALPLAALVERLRQAGATYPAWDLKIGLRVSSMLQENGALWHLGRRGALVFLAVLVTALLLWVEVRETQHFYFHDFANVLPDRQNVSIAKEIARQIETYGDLSSSYIKGWPYWFDGRALRTYLRLAPEAPDRVFNDFIDGQPPLSEVQAAALFILHPADSAGTERLRTEFVHNVSVVHFLPDGTPAFVTVFVER